MGLLSKLLGGEDAGKKLEKLVKTVVEAAERPAARPGGTAAHTAEPAGDSPWPGGFSWGPIMPAEENQYNCGAPYRDYFEHVFRDDFPQLRFERELLRSGKATVYTFFEGSRKALTVELMSEKSEAKQLRRRCAQEGVPYLRFYYDHEGWWNTREYVDARIRGALGI